VYIERVERKQPNASSNNRRIKMNVLQRLIDLSKIALDSGEIPEESISFALDCIKEADATDYLPSLDAEKLYSIVSKFDE
jgi:hypothetical protein